MAEKDKIKREALRKLKEYVSENISLLIGEGRSIDEFVYEPVEGTFTSEEEIEIANITKRIQCKEGLIEYCKYNGIEIEKQYGKKRNL